MKFTGEQINKTSIEKVCVAAVNQFSKTQNFHKGLYEKNIQINSCDDTADMLTVKDRKYFVLKQPFLR